MKVSFAKVLNVIEKINIKLHKSVILLNELNEEREHITQFEKDEKVLEALLNEIETIDLTNYSKVHTSLYHLFLKILDFSARIETIYELSERIIKQCNIQQPIDIYSTLFSYRAKNTGLQYKDQAIYKLEENIKNTKIKKGDYFYIDSFNRNYIVVFDRKGRIKLITDPTGKVLQRKTNIARNECNIVNAESTTRGGGFKIQPL